LARAQSIASSLKARLRALGKHLKPPGNRGDGEGTQEQRMDAPGSPPFGGFNERR
jgi:hypothetical protein